MDVDETNVEEKPKEKPKARPQQPAKKTAVLSFAGEFDEGIRWVLVTIPIG